MFILLNVKTQLKSFLGLTVDYIKNIVCKYNPDFFINSEIKFEYSSSQNEDLKNYILACITNCYDCNSGIDIKV